MRIKEEGIRKIVYMLSTRAGYDWASDDGKICCSVTITAPNRDEAEKIFLRNLDDNGIPRPRNVDSSLRSMEGGKAQVSAEFDVISELLPLLTDTADFTVAKFKSFIEQENAQIALILSKKTEYQWESDVDGIRCNVIIYASDRFNAEKFFEANLRKHNIPLPKIASSIRTTGEGKAEVSAVYSHTSALLPLLEESKANSRIENKENIIDHKAVIKAIEDKLNAELQNPEENIFGIGFFGSRTLSYKLDSSIPKKVSVPTPIKNILELCASAKAGKMTHEKASEKIYDIVHNKVLRLEGTKWDKFVLWIRSILAKLGIPKVKHPAQLKQFYEGINSDLSPKLVR